MVRFIRAALALVALAAVANTGVVAAADENPGMMGYIRRFLEGAPTTNGGAPPSGGAGNGGAGGAGASSSSSPSPSPLDAVGNGGAAAEASPSPSPSPLDAHITGGVGNEATSPSPDAHVTGGSPCGASTRWDEKRQVCLASVEGLRSSCRKVRGEIFGWMCENPSKGMCT